MEKTFTAEKARDSAKIFRDSAVHELEALVTSLNRSIKLLKAGEGFELVDSPELRLKQAREEITRAELLNKLVNHLEG